MQIVKPDTNYQFIAKRKPFLMVSALVVLTFLVLPFFKAPNWGTSFSGGSSILVHFDEPVELAAVRQAFEAEPQFSDVTVQHYGPDGANGYMIKTRATASISCEKVDAFAESLVPGLTEAGVQNVEVTRAPRCDEQAGGATGDLFIRFADTIVPEEGVKPPPGVDAKSGVTVEQIQSLLAAREIDATVTFEKANRRFIVKPAGLQSDVTRILSGAFGPAFDVENGLDEIVTVGPDVGAKFRNDGILSILFALGLILLYIAIRFDVRYAPGAVVALAHDVIITFGLYTVLGLEVTLETVAALLAIVGYSLNDTIVTFDRIRENLQAGTEEPLAVVVNRAINECLSRTLLTSVTTLLAVAVLAFVGTGIIRDFSLTLVIGVLIGTYSSIFVASPIMLWMDGVVERRKAREAVRRKLEEAAEA